MPLIAEQQAKQQAEEAAGIHGEGQEEDAWREQVNGAQDDSSEEIPAIVEELFNEAGSRPEAGSAAEVAASAMAEARQRGAAGLKGKLLAKAGDR